MPHRRARHDRGSQLLEFAAYFPLLVLTSVIAIEAFLAFVAAERLESAARAGARVAGEQGLDGAEATAESALPEWLSGARITTGSTDDGYYTQVDTDLPIVFPAAGFDITLTRRVDMPDL